MTPFYGLNNYYPNNSYNPNNSGLGNPRAAFYQGMSIINSGQPCYDTFGCHSAHTSYSSNSFLNNCGHALYNFNYQASQQLQMLKVYMALMMAQIYLSGCQTASSLTQRNTYSTLLNSLSGVNSTCSSSYSSSTFTDKPLSESEMKVTTKGGKALAQEAYKTGAQMEAAGSKGYCFRGVKRTFNKFGINLQGGSAYMAADQIAGNKNFKEVGVNRSDLKKLPAGAVVVWDRCPGHPHGHVSVALGDGREASDHVQNQIQNYGPSYRVFMPVA